jgi:hypothetical protein
VNYYFQLHYLDYFTWQAVAMMSLSKEQEVNEALLANNVLLPRRKEY